MDSQHGPVSASTTLVSPEVGRGTGHVERTRELRDRAREFAIASRSCATLAAYDSDLRHFYGWADDHGFDPLPTSPETVALYLTSMASGFRASTITRRVSAISVAHQVAGFDSPTTDAAVRSVITGIRRSLGTAPRQVSPATIGEVRRMVSRLSSSTIDLRDRAILLVGFAGAFRRSELVGLDMSDLNHRDDGMLLAVRCSKSDQEGRGDSKALPYGSDPETCPVRALSLWLDRAQIDDGPIFRAVDRHGNVADGRLSGRAVANVVKRAAERVGLDPTAYSGHSLRAGFITTAAATGASERSIARQSGHAPGSTVLRTYIRHASAFTDNAVSVVGL